MVLAALSGVGVWLSFGENCSPCLGAFVARESFFQKHLAWPFDPPVP